MAKKRKLKKKFKLLFFLLLIAIIITYGFTFYKNYNSKKDNNKNNNDVKVVKEEENIYPKTYKLSLVATGDGLLHNSVYNDAYDSTTDTFDFSPQLSMVKDIIGKYDLAYYNQETLFGGKQVEMFGSSLGAPGYSSYPYFNSPSAFGDAMVDIGFNMVSLASNHSCDCTRITKECIINSYNYWKSKDILYAGFNDSEDSMDDYIIKEKNGITYSMLNYTVTLNGLNRYMEEDYLINVYDEQRVKKDIEAIRDKVDVLIVAMHWHTGAEYSLYNTDKNVEIANYLSDLGVDIILGTYSHCLQPFDIINDKTVVFYSLGNFISNQGDLIPTIGYKGIVGALASMDITKTVEKDGSKSIKVDNIGAELIYTYNNNHHNYLVIPFSQMNETYNSKYKEIYDDYVQVLTRLNNNINIVPLSE